MMKEVVWTVAQYGLDIIEYWFGLKILFGARIHRKWLGGVGALLLILFLFVGKWYASDVVLCITTLFAILQYFMAELPGNQKKGWIWIDILIIQYIQTVIASAVRLALNYNQYAETNFLIFCLENVIYFIIVVVVDVLRKCWESFYGNERVSVYIRKAMVAVLVFVVMELFFTVLSLEYIGGQMPEYQFRLSIFSFFAMISIGILIAFVFYIRNNNEKMEQMIEMEKEFERIQKEHYETLLQKEEDTRRYRHDMNNHLLCMRKLAEEGDYHRMQEYLIKMQGKMNQISKEHYATGNKIMDMVLNYYLPQVEAGAAITVKGKCDDEIGISDVDLCSIVSNLVQNAVEAVNNMHAKERFIKVEVKRGRNHLMIMIQNSLERGIQYKENGRIRTIKEDEKNHGMGIANVESAVIRNGGIFEYGQGENQFWCRIKLKIDDH